MSCYILCLAWLNTFLNKTLPKGPLNRYVRSNKTICFYSVDIFVYHILIRVRLHNSYANLHLLSIYTIGIIFQYLILQILIFIVGLLYARYCARSQGYSGIQKKKKKILCLTLKAFFLVGMINKKINKLETGIKQWQVQ